MKKVLAAVASVAVVVIASAQGPERSRDIFSISGYVIDQDGNVVFGAEVHATPAYKSGLERQSLTSLGRFNLSVNGPGRYFVYCFKDDDGYRHLDEALVRLDPEGVPLVVVTEQSPKATTVVRLRPGAGKLTVKLIDSETGRPLEKAQLILRREHSPNDQFTRPLTPFTRNGTIKMLVPSLPLELSASAPGYQSWSYTNTNLKDTPNRLFLAPDETKEITVALRPVGKNRASKTSFSSNLHSQTDDSHAPQSKVKVSVEDGRPVAKAITLLEAQLGWVITYEDPPYANSDDISDVTQSVRRDLHKFKPGQAPKVLVPKGGAFVFEYASGDSNQRLDPNVIVQQLLIAHEESGNAGRFRLVSGERITHVVPAAIKDVAGRVVPQESVLDVTISISAKERNGLRMLEALCAEVSKSVQAPVVVGMAPYGLFLRHKENQAVERVVARDFLVQLLERAGNGRRLSWQLFYGPGTKMYVLNIHPV